MPQEINCKIIIPTILIDKSLKLLEIEAIKIDEYFSCIVIKDAVDLWLVLRAIDKEISYIIDFFPNLLKKLNINPPEGVMWIWK